MRAYDPVRWKADDTGSEPGPFKDWVFNDDGAEVPDALRFWREDLAANDDYGVATVPGYGFRPAGRTHGQGVRRRLRHAMDLGRTALDYARHPRAGLLGGRTPVQAAP